MTVTMNRDDYLEKVHEHFKDQNVYEKIDENPNIKLQRKLNSMFLELKKRNKFCYQ